MKKLLALLLAIVMVFTLVACTGGVESDPAAEKIAQYVADNETELLSTMEESFATSSGMTCTSSIEAVGKGFVINININELDEVGDEYRTAMQGAYDAFGDTFDSLLVEMQEELPELEYYEIRVCEVDGDLIATIKAGN